MHPVSSSAQSLSATVSSTPARSPHRLLTLRQRARFMRCNPTTSEQLLWYHLRGRQLHAVQFRRQVVIDSYIVDFCASSLKLIVEVDGGYHASVVRLDAKREAKLTRRGYHILRVSHELVISHTPAAVSVVRASVEAPLLG